MGHCFRGLRVASFCLGPQMPQVKESMGLRGCAYPQPGAPFHPRVRQDGALEFLAFVSSQSGSTQLFLPGPSSRVQATPPVAGTLTLGEWTRGGLLHGTEGNRQRLDVFPFPCTQGPSGSRGSWRQEEEWGRPGLPFILLCCSVNARGGDDVEGKRGGWVDILALPLRSFETWGKLLNSSLLVSSSVSQG